MVPGLALADLSRACSAPRPIMATLAHQGRAGPGAEVLSCLAPRGSIVSRSGPGALGSQHGRDKGIHPRSSLSQQLSHLADPRQLPRPCARQPWQNRAQPWHGQAPRRRSCSGRRRAHQLPAGWSPSPESHAAPPSRASPCSPRSLVTPATWLVIPCGTGQTSRLRSRSCEPLQCLTAIAGRCAARRPHRMGVMLALRRYGGIAPAIGGHGHRPHVS